MFQFGAMPELSTGTGQIVQKVNSSPLVFLPPLQAGLYTPARKIDLQPSVPEHRGTRVLGPLDEEFETRRPLETAGPVLYSPFHAERYDFEKGSGAEGG